MYRKYVIWVRKEVGERHVDSGVGIDADGRPSFRQTVIVVWIGGV